MSAQTKHLRKQIRENTPSFSKEIYSKAPLRPSGEVWPESCLMAAELYAQGVAWKHIANVIGAKVGTARNYKSRPGFNDLVDYFRSILHKEFETVESAPPAKTESTPDYVERKAGQSKLMMMVEKAYDVILESMEDPDPKMRLDGAKAALEYTGYGTYNKTAAKHKADAEYAETQDGAIIDVSVVKRIAKNVYGIDIQPLGVVPRPDIKALEGQLLDDEIEDADYAE